MADDAMEWHPTTPPVSHNPYAQPQYMPGGWPSSPPPFQYTDGVFARKRKSTFVECATKRVCTGIQTVGAFATIPVRPVYALIRILRARTQKEPSVLRGDHLDSRTRTVATGHLRPSRHLLQPSQQNTINSSTAPAPLQSRDFSSHARNSVVGWPIVTDSHSVSRTNNIENPALSPTSPDQVTEPNTVDHIRTGVKRFRIQKNRDHSQQPPYLSVHSPRLAAYQNKMPTSTEGTISNAKSTEHSNHFDAGSKSRRGAPGRRNGSTSVRVKPIGAKLDSNDESKLLFGGWHFEKPIGPSGQNTGIPTPPTSPAESSAHDFRDKNFGVKDPQTSTDCYDKQLSNGCIANTFYSKVSYPTNLARTQTFTMDDTSFQSTSHRISDSTTERLFFANKPEITPPPIRQRLVPPDGETLAQCRQPNVDDVAHIHPSLEDDTADIVTKNEENNDSLTIEPPVFAHDADMDTGIKSETKVEDVRGLANDMKTTVPVTPPKASVEKSVDHTKAVSEFETPADQLSKLKIKDVGDDETPKAVPHSGTKTTRITRYREALEKAQRAKLEQYELVPITKEWDEKVRAAVRHGIPDYLGSHDLARVVPQYAGRGQDNWLNDETINKYLDLVAAHGRKNDRADQVRSHHAFNNFFYNNLRSKGPDSVTKWSKRAKIGGKNLMYVEKVFVPINSGAHWTLAVVEPVHKKVTHYNSMRGTAAGTRACEDLLGWVAAEQGKDFQEEEWILTAVGESPQQTNSDDCGVFTITSARQIMLGYTPMSYGPAQIPTQRIRIVAELINRGLLRSSAET